MSAATPILTVIVPAYRCAAMLRACLAGLLASDLPRAQWELIVVDDGSPDDTPVVAATAADRVLRVANGPRGPGHARNEGAKVARGDVLLFVDADVVVAPGTLSATAALFAADPTLTAAFGAYDDAPADPGLVSQYRNLLHRWVHLRHAGEAETFWAGCGAVRRADFLAVGGFDTVRFPRPQVEDIELGYRLRARGGRIVLDPAMQGKHLKRWTLWGMLRTDLLDRAVPWARLLLARTDRGSHRPLNLERREQLFTLLAGGMVLATTLGVLFREAAWLWGALACAGLIVAGNAPLFAWFGARRGWGFALVTVPLRLGYYLVAGTGAAWAMLTPARMARVPAPSPLIASPDAHATVSP